MQPVKTINAIKRLTLASLITLTGSASALAADLLAVSASPTHPVPLTWNEAIRSALEQHPAIQVAQHAAGESEAVVKQLESANYPQVSGIYANSGGNTRVLANLGISGSLPKPVTYLTTPGLRVDLLITDFGNTAHRILAQQALAASSEKTVLTAKALVILQVQQAYLTCLTRQRIVDIAREVLKERELIRVQADTLFQHRLKSKLDVDFASVEASRTELALIDAQNQLQAAFAELATALGRPAPQNYKLDPVSFTMTPAPPVEQLFQEAMRKRPELLGSQDRLRAAEEALAAAKALNLGHVSALGTTGYTWWSGPEFSAHGTQTNPGEQLGWWGAGITSSFPLFTGGRIQGQVDQAAASKDEARAATRALANDIVLQVAQAYLSRLTAEQQIAVAQERVTQAREAFTLAQERYTVGLGSILDVTTAAADVLAAEVGLAESQYGYQASDAALAYATGAEYGRY